MMETKTMINEQAHIGIEEESRQALGEMLNALLADSALLYFKVKNFHWNVRGPHFTEYHNFFDELAAAIIPNIDDLAERTRALGIHSVGSMVEYLERTHLQENTQRGLKAEEMLQELLSDYEQVIRQLRSDVDKASTKFHDEGTADFLTGLMEEQEKQAWMIRSHILPS